MIKDPRSEAEKARADLARNAEMGTAVPQSPIEQRPSVTPATFGDTTEIGRVRSGIDQGLEAGGVVPAGHDGGSGQSPAEAEQIATGRNQTAPSRVAAESGSDEDVLSRANE